MKNEVELKKAMNIDEGKNAKNNIQESQDIRRRLEFIRKTTYTVEVSNLPENAIKMEFKAIFWRAGKILDTFLPKDHRTGSCTGIGFLRFGKLFEAHAAIDMCKGRIWRGKLLNATLSSVPESTDSNQILTEEAEVGVGPKRKLKPFWPSIVMKTWLNIKPNVYEFSEDEVDTETE
ncbi:type I inositol polyphosphate 5-phosphatase 2 isoform X1 [Cinnamomum micranthum f. kanehirae]|uniref:Type I inositol polyphosphate 5-phosphatase 2 isoform X1 n=1 Tax=Cinnamomum micranthum f. kanehirae TaxID=337451 RepID=A0A3S3P5B0_9MAGN|nr:type I inositol polyphosphate 5-phosphatase 2 isoform X1 [Cinnamomum micranthum f. kanehirae]